ncbi:MAG: hypothetical protein QNJ84_15640 [Alphaproteobacteria bacterium]|nr:hypothetical protein [Alphaproteobacteria bacterium]
MSENQLVEQGKKKEPLAGRMPLGAWIGAGACAVLLLVIGTTIESDDARNLILLVGGAVGLGLAAWRGLVMQGNLDLERERSSRDDRFRKKQLAMEQLASDNPVVRRAGELGLIAAMEDKEEERPHELAQLLSEYISYNSGKIEPSN